MPRILAAIVDTLAMDYVGPPMVVRHEAAAVRLFDDVARTPNNVILQHSADTELWQLATIDEDTLEMTPDKRVLITAKQWIAAQPKTEETE